MYTPATNYPTYSTWLQQITKPEHPYYHEFQLTLFAGVTYIGTTYLSSIYPERAMIFAAAAYAIHQLTLNFFAYVLPLAKGNNLALRAKQILHLSSTLIISKIICHILGEALTMFECIRITGIFLISLFIVRESNRRFSEYLSKGAS